MEFGCALPRLPPLPGKVRPCPNRGLPPITIATKRDPVFRPVSPRIRPRSMLNERSTRLATKRQSPTAPQRLGEDGSSLRR